MVSAAMAVQEEHGSPTSDKILLEINITDKCVRFKEQLTTGDDFALKVRKPYTISKQRERWTEEEHKRFLEALKLYGRAWRKIEVHVGTKTAVQIRSHAQKFFSKIVRESNNGDASYAKAIEIPPPRPKRKPIHPYPRKLVSLVKSENSIPEKLARSVSQDLSMSEQENQSPISVLSANSSDASAGADSCTPNGSLSPVSSTRALDAGTVFGSEVPNVISDDVGSQAGHEDENSNPDEEVPLKMELLSQNDDLVQEDQSAVQCLKLFVCLPWLTLCGGASLSTREVHNPTPMKAQLCEKKEKLDKNEQNEVSSSSSNTDLVTSPSDGERSWDVDSFSSFLESKGNVEKSFSSSKLRKRTSANSEDCRKGFVPYKRCSPEQDSAVSSTETA